VPLALGGGATGSVLSLSNVQTTDGGTYDVVVTNAYGSVTSSNATLTVAPIQCAPVPSGIVSWWQAEGNTADTSGPNNGNALNGAGFAAGKVGQAFSYQITATNSPTSFNATGLPAGLSINTTTGLISGTPTTAGATPLTIRGTDANGCFAGAALAPSQAGTG